MKRIIIKEFTIADSEDPWLYAAQPIWEWEQTEQGKWIMENSINPEFNVTVDHHTMGYRVNISASLSEQNITYFQLKWA